MTVDEIRAALEAIDVPAPQAVARYAVRAGRDATDDPAVWVFVVVRDEELDDLWPVWDRLRKQIRDTVTELAGSEVIPYVRMWATSEVGESARGRRP